MVVYNKYLNEDYMIPVGNHLNFNDFHTLIGTYTPNVDYLINIWKKINISSNKTNRGKYSRAMFKWVAITNNYHLTMEGGPLHLVYGDIIKNIKLYSTNYILASMFENILIYIYTIEAINTFIQTINEHFDKLTPFSPSRLESIIYNITRVHLLIIFPQPKESPDPSKLKEGKMRVLYHLGLKE
jgi:hypothetical protein